METVASQPGAVTSQPTSTSLSSNVIAPVVEDLQPQMTHGDHNHPEDINNLVDQTRVKDQIKNGNKPVTKDGGNTPDIEDLEIQSCICCCLPQNCCGGRCNDNGESSEGCGSCHVCDCASNSCDCCNCEGGCLLCMLGACSSCCDKCDGMDCECECDGGD